MTRERNLAQQYGVVRYGSLRAALVYQHATDERAKRIAEALSDLVARQSHVVEAPLDRGHAGQAGDVEPAS